MNTFTNKVSEITSKINTAENKELLKESIVATMVINVVLSFFVPSSFETKKTLLPSMTDVTAVTIEVGLIFWGKKIGRNDLEDVEL